jgi:PAS domain S-box-containing protein
MKSKNHYWELYNFGPVGHIKMNDKGLILEANLSAARFLGVEGETLSGRFFSGFIRREWANAWRLHLRKVFETRSKQICEMMPASQNAADSYVQAESVAIRSESGEFNHCQTVLWDITDLKRGESALMDSEEKLKAVVYGSPIPTFVIDRDHKIVYWNKALEQITGIEAGSLIGTNHHWKAFYDQERPCLADLMLTGKEFLMKRWYGPGYSKSRLVIDGYECTDFIPTPENGGKWLHFTAAAIRDSKGNVVGAVETLEDITESKRAEEALLKAKEELETKVLERTRELRKTYERLQLELAERRRARKTLETARTYNRTLFETSIEPLLTTGVDGRISEVNPAMECITGLSSEQLIGTQFLDHVTDPVKAKAGYQRILQEGRLKDYELEIRHKDGNVTPAIFGASVYRDSSGEIAGIFASVRDNANRKRAEKALRESEQNFVAVFQRSPVPMVVTSAVSGKLVDVNEVFLRSTGYAREEVIGRTSRELQLFADYEDRERLIAEVGCKGHAYGLEMDVRLKSGEIRRCLITTSVMQLSGQPHLISSVLNITELKKAEKEGEALRAQLLQIQKMEAIGTFTGGIAHDFNNLLCIINGYTELVLSEKSEDDPGCDDLRKVLEAGRKGAELVQRLLTLGKKNEIMLEPIAINSVVKNSLALIKRTFPKMIAIEVNLDKNLSSTTVAAPAVEQAFMNLCINAKEAMPDGGVLKIETRNVTLGEEYCGSHLGAKPGLYALLKVTDTGAGMGPEITERIYEPFFTTKKRDFNKGTSLGLSVTKGIVEQLGGWITRESEPNVGTTLGMYLPTMAKQSEPKRMNPETCSKTGVKTILLVDDEKMIRDLGKRILERAGYEVITASDGKEALAIYATEPSKIALIVLDLIMPQMGGIKCLDELLAINPRVKTIVSTGHSLEPNWRDRFGECVRGVISKPYPMKRFVEVVEEALAG